MASPITVNVIGKEHNYGLKHDADIIIALLNRSGFAAKFQTSESIGGWGWRQRARRLLRRLRYAFCYGWANPFFPKADLNIFLEGIPRHLFQTARRQVFIPNQEWFGDGEDIVKDFDLVACKTQAAVEIFSRRGGRTTFIGFTSLDRRTIPDAPKLREFLMITGNIQNITERVIALWARHPEWPRLTLSSRWIPPGVDLPNVRLMRDFVPAEEIVRLQNEILFQLCITAAEGFGHKFLEGFSCGAIVVAVDGAPMNEIVQPDRGVLVKWERTNALRLGQEYHFDVADLERAIEALLRLTPGEIAALSASARAWFEENDTRFREEFPAVLENLVAASRSTERQR